MAENTNRISCRKARRMSTALINNLVSDDVAASLRHHINDCPNCGREYRIALLSRTALDAAASSEPIAPDSAFFSSLRARIERGPAGAVIAEDSWATALFLTARQLVPAMAVLLLLIIGATLFWNLSHRQNLARQEYYELQEPRPDDGPESIVALEERRNGK